MLRDSRSLRLFTVESHIYDPPAHSEIFFGAINHLLSSAGEAYGPAKYTKAGELFDLLVFPEIFLPAADLLTLVNTLAEAGPIGCIHTGLRADTSEQFLFTRDRAAELVDNLIHAGSNPSDLAGFRSWLMQQGATCYFNLGAVIAVDASASVRVALHPKVLRSKYELSPIAAQYTTEANLLTLITLFPSRSNLLPVTLQPLLCSDMLIGDSDGLGARPIEGITVVGSTLAQPLPEYVDVISLATCTPHPVPERGALWHTDFRDGFLRMAKDDLSLRHRHAISILSNYVQIPTHSRQGGLSGLYLPFQLRMDSQPEYVTTPQYGIADREEDPRWHVDKTTFQRKFAHMVCMRPASREPNAVATMLGATLHRMPKETNQFHPAQGLINYVRASGSTQPDGKILFT